MIVRLTLTTTMTPKSNKKLKHSRNFSQVEQSPEIAEKFSAFVEQTNIRLNELIESKIVELKEVVRNELKSSYDELRKENEKNLKTIDKLSARLNELEQEPDSPVTLEDIFEQGVGLKSQQKELHDQTKSIVETIDTIITATSELRKEVTTVKGRMQVIEDNNEKSTEKLKAVDMKLNRQHQNNLRNCMEIKGISSTEMRNVRDWKQFTVTTIERLGGQCETSQIEKAYKTTVPNSEPPCDVLIVWFRNYEDKERIMMEKYEKETKSQRKSGIFLNHALTGYNRALISKARKTKNQLCMSIVNFSNGRIKMKGKKGDRPTVINSFEELDTLLSQR